MSITSKLSTINSSLHDIKLAILSKGQSISGNITTFANAISNISSGEINNTNITITPSTSEQNFLPTSPYTGFGYVTVNAVTNSIDQNISPENIKKDISILGVTGEYEGSGTSDKYNMFEVIKDDNDNNVGIVVGFTYDTNGNKVNAIVYVADISVSWSASSSTSPSINTWDTLSFITETATDRTTTILTYQPRSTVSNCRNYTAVIDGVTYYGQLATYPQSYIIAGASTIINSIIDNLNYYNGNTVSRNSVHISSSQRSTSQIWCILAQGNTGTSSGSRGFVVFELPM